MSAGPDPSHHKGKVNLQYVSSTVRSPYIPTTDLSNSDASGAEKKEVASPNHTRSLERLTNESQELDTSTAILKKKKKPNSLM